MKRTFIIKATWLILILNPVNCSAVLKENLSQNALYSQRRIKNIKRISNFFSFASNIFLQLRRNISPLAEAHTLILLSSSLFEIAIISFPREHYSFLYNFTDPSHTYVDLTRMNRSSLSQALRISATLLFVDLLKKYKWLLTSIHLILLHRYSQYMNSFIIMQKIIGIFTYIF